VVSEEVSHSLDGIMAEAEGTSSDDRSRQAPPASHIPSDAEYASKASNRDKAMGMAHTYVGMWGFPILLSSELLELLPRTISRPLDPCEQSESIAGAGLKKGCCTRVVLIDVRSEAERQVSVIAGSISRGEFERMDWSESVNKSEILAVPYCTMGYRSGQYCLKLKDMGFSNIKNSEGIVLFSYAIASASAVDAGAVEGGSSVSTFLVDTEGKPTKVIHTYGSKWDLAHPTFSSVIFTDLYIFFERCWSWLS
jgi:rhodanese-related sulfurtransferase